jgi:hypothetical protein
MIPVTQRIEGWPNGECVRAAYATILGLPIDAVPRLDPGISAVAGQVQGNRERMWLSTLGLGLYEISCDPQYSLPQEILDSVPEVPHLMSGISPRGFGHRVVGIGGKIVHDPHPSRAGLVSIYSVGILVPYGTKLDLDVDAPDVDGDYDVDYDGDYDYEGVE